MAINKKSIKVIVFILIMSFTFTGCISKTSSKYQMNDWGHLFDNKELIPINKNYEINKKAMQ